MRCIRWRTIRTVFILVTLRALSDECNVEIHFDILSTNGEIYNNMFHAVSFHHCYIGNSVRAISSCQLSLTKISTITGYFKQKLVFFTHTLSADKTRRFWNSIFQLVQNPIHHSKAQQKHSCGQSYFYNAIFSLHRLCTPTHWVSFTKKEKPKNNTNARGWENRVRARSNGPLCHFYFCGRWREIEKKKKVRKSLFFTSRGLFGGQWYE